ncbi:ABC transporter permease [candidate division KSB3 bacterium]|uniref:Autoinducer 2 import system permease protein LsrD n=1 Tax=candidate division KSB3 bacterium TaxID=2044937 RepID=A0A9D5Q6L2_9BACT|nr:ABC transporter permease [candidate division KSB3 bacterium]
MKIRHTNIRNFVLSYGFIGILILMFIGYSVGTRYFFTLDNIMGILHTAAPTMILASGLALVIMSAKIDISIGSISFISAVIGASLIVHYDMPPLLGLLVIVLIGALCGALNGFIVVYLKVNPLITTMGTLFTLRGAGLRIARGRMIDIPEGFKNIGNLSIGPLYVDILVALGILLLIHLMHTRTKFGRHIMAIGNGEDVARRLGVRVARVTFLTFVLSGFLASLGGIFSMFQLGAVTMFMGEGLEFTAIAVIIIGGISLFGGEGAIIPHLILGVLTLVIIENGLNHLGASPYVYPFVRGGVIFIAMYADSLKSMVQTKVKVLEPE